MGIKFWDISWGLFSLLPQTHNFRLVLAEQSGVKKYIYNKEGKVWISDSGKKISRIVWLINTFVMRNFDLSPLAVRRMEQQERLVDGDENTL